MNKENAESQAKKNKKRKILIDENRTRKNSVDESQYQKKSVSHSEKKISKKSTPKNSGKLTSKS